MEKNNNSRAEVNLIEPTRKTLLEDCENVVDSFRRKNRSFEKAKTRDGIVDRARLCLKYIV